MQFAFNFSLLLSLLLLLLLLLEYLLICVWPLQSTIVELFGLLKFSCCSWCFLLPILFCLIGWLVYQFVCLYVNPFMNAWRKSFEWPSSCWNLITHIWNLSQKQMSTFLQKSQLLGPLVFDQLRANSNFADRIIFLHPLVLELCPN